MVRIPNMFLPHRIDIRAVNPVGTSQGASFQPVKPNVRAQVLDKVTMVVDQRSSSETFSQSIASSSTIVVQPEEYVEPGSEIVVWKGTPQERSMHVVAAGYYRHTIAPESAQFWLV